MKNTNSAIRVPIVASLGGMLEFFDFSLFLFLIDPLTQAFFSDQSSIISYFKTLVIFALGYVIRPLGGIYFGHLGDRLGRKKSFQISLAMMSLSCFLIAIIPTYNQIGIFAPVLLLILRVFQGFSLGGEIPGAATFSVEHFPKTRGRTIGLLFLGVTWGMLLTSILLFILKSILSPIEFNALGWRISFFIGGATGLIVLWLRSSFLEPQLFVDYLKERSNVPFVDMMKTSKSQVWHSFLVMGLTSGTIFIMARLPEYISSYTSLKLSIGGAFSTLYFLIYGVFILISGFLSDKFGRRKMMLIGCVTGGVGSMIFFTSFLIISNYSELFLFMIFWAAMMALSNGTYACYAIERFPTRHRLTGFAFSYNMGFAIFGGLFPLILTAVLHAQSSPVVLGVYVLLLSMVSFFGVYFSKDFHFKHLRF